MQAIPAMTAPNRSDLNGRRRWSAIAQRIPVGFYLAVTARGPDDTNPGIFIAKAAKIARTRQPSSGRRGCRFEISEFHLRVFPAQPFEYRQFLCVLCLLCGWITLFGLGEEKAACFHVAEEANYLHQPPAGFLGKR